MADRVIQRNDTFNNAPPDKIETESIPANDEEFLAPPGMELPKEETKKEETKPGEGKLHWDYGKLLQQGTLGDLAANLHHAVAEGTDFPKWELTGDEKGQYDKVLGMILEPLMQKIEYLPLVVGILSLAMIESTKVGSYMKFKKEQNKSKETVQRPVETVTTVSPLPNRPAEIIVEEAYDPRTGRNLDADLPPLTRRNTEPDVGIPPPPKNMRPPGF